MLEKREITKKLIKNMLINVLIFTAILVIFDLIIYNNIVISLYKDVDIQLETSIQKDNKIEKNNRDRNIERFVNNALDERIINPRLIIIERDKDGNILNDDRLGAISNYLNEIQFNATNLENIYNLQIGLKYEYRAINYETTEEGETKYLQVLANVDGEARNIRELI